MGRKAFTMKNSIAAYIYRWKSLDIGEYFKRTMKCGLLTQTLEFLWIII